jgi:hypothetical protein
LRCGTGRETDFPARLAANIEALILREGPDTIAAFIAEPVIRAGGGIVPPEGYFDAVHAVLGRYDIHFIVDEVITGFGRLGTWFGSEAFGLKPDTVSMAKALTSGYAPLGAVTVPEPVYQAMLDESRKIGAFAYRFTYGGHPLAAAIALKTLEIYERDDIIGKAARLIPHFQARLKAFSGHPLVGEARGMGLMGGVELVADKASKRPFHPKLFVGTRVRSSRTRGSSPAPSATRSPSALPLSSPRPRSTSCSIASRAGSIGPKRWWRVKACETPLRLSLTKPKPRPGRMPERSRERRDGVFGFASVQSLPPAHGAPRRVAARRLRL